MTHHGLSWDEALDLTIPQAAAVLTGAREEGEVSPERRRAWMRELRERRAERKGET